MSEIFAGVLSEMPAGSVFVLQVPSFTIITLFPEFFTSPLRCGLLGKAVAAGIVDIDIVDLRTFSDDAYGRCDDAPYGGGSGMVLKPEPLFKAIDACRRRDTVVISTAPGGKRLHQNLVKELSGEEELCIICGNYEGIDQRVIDRYVDLEVSVGDYVLSGGEFAALIIVDAITRYVPGFMSNCRSLNEESFEDDLLEYPQYTRPIEIDGLRVPEVLMSGNHERIRLWRLRKSVEKTRRERPDLYRKHLFRRMRGEET